MMHRRIANPGQLTIVFRTGCGQLAAGLIKSELPLPDKCLAKSPVCAALGEENYAALKKVSEKPDPLLFAGSAFYGGAIDGLDAMFDNILHRLIRNTEEIGGGKLPTSAHLLDAVSRSRNWEDLPKLALALENLTNSLIGDAKGNGTCYTVARAKLIRSLAKELVLLKEMQQLLLEGDLLGFEEYYYSTLPRIAKDRTNRGGMTAAKSLLNMADLHHAASFSIPLSAAFACGETE